jgi:hypothetical protein
MPEVASVSAQIDKSGTSVCAFVAPETVNGEELKRCLGARVPQYMVPKAVYCLSRLPLNTNDKTDHKIIQKTMNDLITTAKRARSDSIVLPPSPPMSLSPSPVRRESSFLTSISKLWTEFLGLEDPPQPSDNFFDLGGNRWACWQFFCLVLKFGCAQYFGGDSDSTSQKNNSFGLLGPLGVFRG